MAVAGRNKLDTAVYGRLLARTLPRVIQTEKENERMIAELEKLDSLKRPLTWEEKQLADLMTLLVRQFEEEHYPMGDVEPAEALRVMMEFRGLRQRDLVPIFGSRSGVSDALSRKRSISKANARKLAEYFHVPADMFI